MRRPAVFRVPEAGRIRISSHEGRGVWLEYHRAFAPSAREKCVLPPDLARAVAGELLAFAEACDAATSVGDRGDLPAV